MSDYSTDPVCIWCGRPCPGEASFRFLASRSGEFVVGHPEEGWADHDEATLEGHQFFCHAECFKNSVPEAQQYASITTTTTAPLSVPGTPRFVGSKTC